MKQGKYFRLPDEPSDVQQIWRTAQPLPSGCLPKWLPAEQKTAYRYLGTFSRANLSVPEQEGYFAEMRQLQAAGAIIEQDLFDSDVQRIFITAPRKEAVWSIGVYLVLLARLLQADSLVTPS